MGGHQPDSQSARIGAWLAARWCALGNHDAVLIDLGKVPLPLWEPQVWAREGTAAEQWQPVAERLANCDALILVAAEYAGSAPPALKNFFLFCDGGELAHKPALPVGVSTGMGGAYPVAELRTTSHKNTHLCYIPEQLIVRDAASFQPDDPDPADATTWLAERADFALRMLATYAAALKPVGGELRQLQRDYPYGM